MNKKLPLLLLVLAMSGTLEAQTTIVLNPDKDNSIYSNTVNPPSDLPRSNGVGVFLFAGRISRGSFLRRALIRFDVAASVPAGANILSASLSLDASKIPPQPFPSSTIDVLTLNTDWGEGASDANGPEGQGIDAEAGDATWDSPFNDATAWTTAGGDFATSPSASTIVDALGSFTWGSNAAMIANVQDWLDSPATNFGWILRGSESANLTARRFNSREHPEVTTRPRLTITYSSLPVELTDFFATSEGNKISISWTTVSEENNAGFQVEMSELSSHGSDTASQISWDQIGFVEGNGTSTESHSYVFNHIASKPGKYMLRLKQIDFDGAFQYSDAVETIVEVAGSHLLSQTYPNPFSSASKFSLNIAESQSVEINLFNALGQKVREVFSGVMEANIQYDFRLEAKGLPTGLYFVRAEGQSFADSRRTVIIK